MDRSADEPADVLIGGLRFVPMIGERDVREAVSRIADAITERMADADPLLVCVLNGGALFHSDLIRHIPMMVDVDYLRVASYHGGVASSGTITFTAAPGTSARERNVILVEDIVDTGRTLRRLREYYRNEGAASVAVAALLYKPDADQVGHAPEFLGFEIPNRFVIGYGLDYRHRGRNLPSVYVLAEEGDPRS